ncbi:MAG TPA: flavoprotein [Thermoanaerobaculia bacterium]|nr:flavoprotein [Thermoanaerobaculia bacterium]
MPALDHIYLVITGAGTARRAPDLLVSLTTLGPTLVVLTTPNAARIVAPRELTLALDGRPGHRVVESYFDDAILPRPPYGLVLVAPCSFDSLNKLALGIADNLALSVVAEAIGRQTPVIVAVSVNPPLWAHPQARRSVETLRSWGVEVIEPVPLGDALTLAPDEVLIAAVRRRLATD